MDSTVTLTISRVRQIDNPDGFLGGDGDYYAKVTMSGVERRSPTADSPDFTPNWTFRQGAAPNSVLPIRIELWDSDTGDDDMADVNPRGAKKRIDFNYNIFTGEVTGDVTGRRGGTIQATGAGDSDRAEIWFSVDHAAPQLPERLPEVWACDVPIKLLWNATSQGPDLAVVEGRLREFNDRLYRCTDGQWRVGRFFIADNRNTLDPKGAGVGHVHRDDIHGPHGHADGRPARPNHWEVNEFSGAGVYLMEFLHSWTGLKDEYETHQDGPGTSCPADPALADASEACVMDDTSGLRWKLCRPETHNPNTEQGHERHMDCYSWLRNVMHASGRTGFQVPPGYVAGPYRAPTLRFVYLTVHAIKQIDDPDGGSKADYYAKLKVDGAWFKNSKHLDDRTSASPGWIFGFAFSSDHHRVLPMRLELWDYDSFSRDEMCDINPRRGKKSLDFAYDTATGRITGEVTGSRDVPITLRGSGDDDRAEITFSITSR